MPAHIRDIISPTAESINAEAFSWRIYGLHGSLNDNPFGVSTSQICMGGANESYPVWADYQGTLDGYNFDTRLLAYGDTLDEVNLSEATANDRNASMGWAGVTQRVYCMVFFANEDITSMEGRQALHFTSGMGTGRTGVASGWDETARDQFRIYING